MLTLRLVFHLALRQAEGFAGSVLRLLGLDLLIPDHTTLSRRSRKFSEHRPHTVLHGPVHLVIDSTGLKLFGQGEWNEEKHGRTRRSWRKLHLALDADTGELVARVLTGNDLDDAGQTPVLLDQVDAEIASVTADGAYDGEPVYQAIASKQADKPPTSSSRRAHRRRRAPQPARLRVCATVTSAPLRRRAGWLGRRQPVTAVVASSRPRSVATKASSALAYVPVGDLRTDALHEALQDENADIDSEHMVALVLAFGGRNVSVQSGAALGNSDREQIAETLTEGGTLTRDAGLIRTAARAMLVAVLSCRDNMTSSGAVARIAGDSVGATLRLPNMATDAFLSCLSKTGVEKVAAAEGVRIEARGKDTRAAVIESFKDGRYVHPAAVFQLTAQEIEDAKSAAARRWVPDGGYKAGTAYRDDDDDVLEAGNEFANEDGADGSEAVSDNPLSIAAE